MSLSFSLKRLISGQNIEEERHKHDPSRAKQRHIFRRPLKKLSVFNKYFEFHKVFSLETNTTGKQCSMARNANNVFMGLTRETHPCQQNSPPEPFKLPENSSPTIASEDCDILPSVELNTHTNAQNFDSNVAWHGSMHDHDSSEGHANLRPFLDPEDITRSLHSEQTAGQTKTQAPSAIDLRRETSRTTVHEEELDPYHNLPMNDHPHSKRLRDELEQRLEELLAMKKE